MLKTVKGAKKKHDISFLNYITATLKIQLFKMLNG